MYIGQGRIYYMSLKSPTIKTIPILTPDDVRRRGGFNQTKEMSAFTSGSNFSLFQICYASIC